jgi:DNA-binding NarL/FixJ family response regulator
MHGEEAYRELRRINPNARIILSSGYSEQEAMSRFTGAGLAGFIQKPYKPGALIDKVRSTLQRFSS